jgi:lipopolysaccharide/colanic/teichoic acid biosynthesis glycosyltransferase
VRSLALKRAIDVVGASLALGVAAIPMAVIALAVRVRHGAPTLFSQERPGLHGRPFIIHKFRTMTDRRGPDGRLLPDDQRLTGLGRFLRSTSLDELPELVCVLRGDMSLVGPRPWLMQYLDRYSPDEARRHDMRPGITGLAVASGRNAVSWDDRLALDLEYVDTWTIKGDLQIIGRTIGGVLRREGISAEGHATMPEFEGSRQDGAE